MATSAVNGNAAGFTFATNFVVHAVNWGTIDFPTVAVFRVRQSGQTSIENVRHWIGLFSADPSASDNPAVHMAAFRYTAPTTTRVPWEICVNNGGTTQVRATQFAAPSGTVTGVGDYLMRIEFHHRPVSTAAGYRTIRFFINDVYVGEFRNGNLPTTVLAPLVRVTNVGAGSGRVMWFSRFAYIQR